MGSPLRKELACGPGRDSLRGILWDRGRREEDLRGDCLMNIVGGMGLGRRGAEVLVVGRMSLFRVAAEGEAGCTLLRATGIKKRYEHEGTSVETHTAPRVRVFEVAEGSIAESSEDHRVVVDLAASAAEPHVATQPASAPVENTESANQTPPPSRFSAEMTREYAKMDTSILIELPKLPLSSDHDAADLVAFGAALRDYTNDMRVIVGDTDLIYWHPRWVKCLQK